MRTEDEIILGTMIVGVLPFLVVLTVLILKAIWNYIVFCGKLCWEILTE